MIVRWYGRLYLPNGDLVAGREANRPETAALAALEIASDHPAAVAAGALCWVGLGLLSQRTRPDIRPVRWRFGIDTVPIEGFDIWRLRRGRR